MAKGKLPKKIGKYRVTGVIGSGSQAVVLGGTDTALMRDVAIKVLRANSNTEKVDRLIAEARIVSKLRHPNVVTLLDFGLIGKRPYLVFELLKGISLMEELKTNGSLGIHRGVVLMSQILGGVAAAHREIITHGDLSTNNIFLTDNDLPKVMDFGLSSVMRSGNSTSGHIAGTPRYMSPEMLRKQPVGLQSDVFSLGSIFYEMLTGQPHFCETTMQALFKAILEGSIRLPSALNPDVPPVLDEVVKLALAMDTGVRFSSAVNMKEMLDEYRIPRENSGSGNHSTVEFMFRRLEHAPGFSALSGRISEVLELTSSDKPGDTRQITNLVAKDLTLTQRVLTMANSAMYGGAEITTLSHAVGWMGLNQVRYCVTSSLLQSQFSKGTTELRLAQVKAFFSALLSKEIAVSQGLRKKEDAFLGGMFHSLGKMLVMHYFSEEYVVIRQNSLNSDAEINSCREVLGLAYHEIGQQTARHWKLPDQLIESMLPLPRGPVPKTDDDQFLVSKLAALANAIVDALTLEQYAALERIDKLLGQVEKIVQIDHDDIPPLLESISVVAKKYARMMGATDDAAEFFSATEALIEVGRGDPIEASMEQCG